MHSQKVRIRRQSKKLQVQGAQFLGDEAYLEYAAMIHPVKSALPLRFARFNPDGIKDRKRFHWAGTEIGLFTKPSSFYKSALCCKIEAAKLVE